MDELSELKKVLRSLVVSSPTQMDMRTLLKDYRNMVGAPLPYFKHGYKDPVAFLQERCSDCFVLRGQPANPTLTLIVSQNIQHIDAFVKRQKITSTKYPKVKRQSIVQPTKATNHYQPPHLRPTNNQTAYKQEPQVRPTNNQTAYKQEPQVNKIEKQEHVEKKQIATQKCIESQPLETQKPIETKQEVQKETVQKVEENFLMERPETTKEIVSKFLRKRLPLYNSCQSVDSDAEKTLSDSGRQTSSSMSSGKRSRLDELREEVKQIILSFPDGVPCKDLLRLYRDKHSCELNFSTYGYTSIVSFTQHIPSITVSNSNGAWLAFGVAPPPLVKPRPLLGPRPITAQTPPPDPDDALPGIDFDPDVFPPDCISFLESVPGPAVREAAGDMFGVAVGEVYSPSHFWLIRLGGEYNIAMEALMDDMNDYYNSPEGKARQLAVGAVRVGYHCCSLYDGDWHRAIIVHVQDSDTVKIRHIDYGTVESVPRSSLRPLLRTFCSLPAQARRARLAGVRPGANGRRWPFPASRHFLGLVRDRKLVANVVSVDHEEDIMEILLIDTSTSEDISISSQMIQDGHADPRPDSALHSGECYLYPRFLALESGATPNFAEIAELLRRGIVLDCVDSFRRHVPAVLPPDTHSLASIYQVDHNVPSINTLVDNTAEPCVNTSINTVDEVVEDTQNLTLNDSQDTPKAQETPVHTVVPTNNTQTSTTSTNATSNTYANRNRNNTPRAQVNPRFKKNVQHPPPPQNPPRFHPPIQTPLTHAYSQMIPPPQGFIPYPNQIPPPYFYGPMPPQNSMYNSCSPLMPPGPMYPQPPVFYPRNPQPAFAASSANLYTPATQHRSPPPPYNASTDNVNKAGSRFVQTPVGNVTLSASECEIFTVLSRVDPPMAHKYIMDTIKKAARPQSSAVDEGINTTSSLNPDAAEFRFVAAETQTDNVSIGDLISFDDDSEEKPTRINPAVRNFLQSSQNLNVTVPPGFEPEDKQQF